MKIQILAGTGGGKTSMARFIVNKLAEIGITAVITEDGTDNDPPTTLVGDIQRLQAGQRSGLLQDVEIEIVTKQANRDFAGYRAIAIAPCDINDEE